MPEAPLQATIRIAADHPAFDGHFPGEPIVPAVVLLAEALAAIEAATATPAHAWIVTQAKFLAPVGPGAELRLVHEETAGGGRRFELIAGDDVVARASLAAVR